MTHVPGWIMVGRELSECPRWVKLGPSAWPCKSLLYPQNRASGLLPRRPCLDINSLVAMALSAPRTARLGRCLQELEKVVSVGQEIASMVTFALESSRCPNTYDYGPLSLSGSDEDMPCPTSPISRRSICAYSRSWV